VTGASKRAKRPKRPSGRGLLALLALTVGMSACSGSGTGGAGTSGTAASPPDGVSSSPSNGASQSPGTGSGTTSGTTSAGPTTGSRATSPSSVLPHPDHVVVVVMENRSYDDIIGNPRAPYINGLAAGGALFTRSYAVAHPSQPNYLALFSGSIQGLHDDSCPHTFDGPNLGRSLVDTGRSFAGYSEGLPSPGSRVCEDGAYARKHAPWVNFPSVPASANLPFSAFPRDLAALPGLSFVIPDLDHDMHDGSVENGDSWLRDHLGAYVSWAAAHNSLLLLTWDEDDRSESNRVVTVVTGAHVRPGRYVEPIDHYRLFSTLEALEGVRSTGVPPAANPPITSIWTH
jgi:phosphatidylinositol-3-phosphatase